MGLHPVLNHLGWMVLLGSWQLPSPQTFWTGSKGIHYSQESLYREVKQWCSPSKNKTSLWYADYLEHPLIVPQIVLALSNHENTVWQFKLCGHNHLGCSMNNTHQKAGHMHEVLAVLPLNPTILPNTCAVPICSFLPTHHHTPSSSTTAGHPEPCKLHTCCNWKMITRVMHGPPSLHDCHPCSWMHLGGPYVGMSWARGGSPSKHVS